MQEGKESGHDSLTGVYTLDTFKKCLRIFFEEHECHSQYAIICTDIAHFERVNNLYGMERANTLLIQLADSIQETEHVLLYCRSVADHFMCLVEFEDKGKLEVQLTEFCREFNSLATVRFPDATPRLGIGTYIIEDTMDFVDEMIEKVNGVRKCLRGKSTKRVVFYNPIEEEKIQREEAIENEMSHAFYDGEFKVFMQPKYDLVTKKMVGAEALVRWIKKNGTIVRPDEFVPLFEKNGFIRKLDFYMLEQVCDMLKRRLKENKRCLPISINQSRVLLDSENYTSDVAYVLNSYDTPPDLIELELTERIFSDSLDEMAEMMSVLKKLGIKWSIDDFGTGYSSLNLLKKLPVDIIKIDKAFLDETETSNVSRIIIRKTVELTRELDKMVVCEGVETEAQAKYLQEIKCDIAQGFLYAKPMPMQEFEKLLDMENEVA